MDASPIARLAPELRSQLYGLVLTKEQPIAVQCLRKPSENHVLISFEKQLKGPVIPLRRPLALIQTCRVVRQEARSLFYSTNEFRLKLHLNLDLPRTPADAIRAFRDCTVFPWRRRCRGASPHHLPTCLQNIRLREALRRFAAVQAAHPQARVVIDAHLLSAEYGQATQ
ncbi:hypothetical protein EJ03DRAFT_152834 [Teratosphaeria nubilosa]|uniref:Uncharacterized protein n=1 Tax=Teratosphaeria nubilosa TaxID=161662 RepID=A0A6G1LKC2_9PEZI|nr:hypothetical protein EJ03DRAFT_152834 [Teratosphaeria nubilosa]